MLFNSLSFVFGFLPVVLSGFFLLGRYSQRWAVAWLAAASLFFYAWWSVAFLPLLLASATFNYLVGRLTLSERRKPGPNVSKPLVIFGIAGNLAALGYFKYLNFFIDAVGPLLGLGPIAAVILPIGISFYTLTQIAYLVDAYRGEAREYHFVQYLLFVAYFPHLIAGPILYHKQIIPQFAVARTYRIDWSNISVGMMMLAIGLIKKVLIADNFGQSANPIFLAAEQGVPLSMIASWTGSVAYVLQLYFDFSAYSDMAIGLSLMFNVRLPVNFNSPYKATSIVDFWRRWHMTLSAFLLKYVYIPLGGNRRGKVRHYFNLIATMLLGGLWHGAGWTFLLWGALHGVFLASNHAFRATMQRTGWVTGRWGIVGTAVSGGLTFVAVTVAFVSFRSSSLGAAQAVWTGMAGANGSFGPSAPDWQSVMLIAGGLLIVWCAPNSQQFTRLFNPVDQRVEPPSGWTSRLVWHPAIAWSWIPLSLGLAVALLGLAATDRPVEFLYFQF